MSLLLIVDPKKKRKMIEHQNKEMVALCRFSHSQVLRLGISRNLWIYINVAISHARHDSFGNACEGEVFASKGSAIFQ